MESIHSLLTVVITLLIIMDPMGNLPFFILFTRRNTPSERNRMALTAAAAACAILIFFGLTGDYLLRWFSITLPAFQLAGGAIFLIYSLQMLALIPIGIKTSEEEEQESISKENAALVPLAIPLTAGPGAITAVLVWRQGEIQIGFLLLAVIAACFITYIVFRFGEWIHKAMGVSGVRVVSRLMGLLLAVIAVQLMVNGLQQILQPG
jgi:multiple antibiotic resistance protein